MANNFSLARINHFVLSKQHLSEDSRINDIVQIVRDIGGLHATNPMGPYLSLFARASNFERMSLDEELYVKRSLGKIRCVRGTMYILTKEMIPITFTATREIVEKNSTRFLEYRGVSAEQYEKFSKIILNILQGKEMSTLEIKRALKTELDVSSILNQMCDQGLLIRSKPEKGLEGS